MAENKKPFLLYADQRNQFDMLPDETAGKLIKHLFAYINDEDPKSDDILLNVAFAPIKATLKRDLKKYEEIKEKRIKAGKASAAKRQHMSTHVKSVQQCSTNPTVSVSDSDSVSVSDKKNNKYSEDVRTCFRNCLEFFQGLEPKSKSATDKWMNTIKLLHEKDGYSFDQIQQVVKWARNDSFWKNNFLALTKLRREDKDGVRYFLRFNEKVQQKPSKAPNNAHLFMP